MFKKWLRKSGPTVTGVTGARAPTGSSLGEAESASSTTADKRSGEGQKDKKLPASRSGAHPHVAVKGMALPDNPVQVAPLRVWEAEERRATSEGPQIFCVLIDSSISMEEGNKAQEATRVLREFMAYASRQSGVGDGTGQKSYFLTQVVMFAEEAADLTEGIVRPPAALEPPERWEVRSPLWNAKLGNTTDFGKALDLVCHSLAGPQGMTQKRLKAAMPAPIILVITDGKPTRPLPVELAQQKALEAAHRLKSLALPAATRLHPNDEEMTYPETRVKLITIGLGEGDELDQDCLKQMATTVEWEGDEFPLYLHCPDASQLGLIGAQIVGTMTRADQRQKRRLEAVIRGLQSTPGMKAKV